MNKGSSRSNTWASLVMIGLGLVMLGVILSIYLGGQVAVEEEYSTTPVEVNYAAPGLKLHDMDGKLVSLDMYRGQVVLVNLWATWCPPCKAEMPTLNTFYQKYKDQGFVIVAIDDGESVDLVVPFVEEYGLTFPIWLDQEYATEKAFGTINLPSSWVLDRKGTVRLSWVGAISRRNLEKYIPPIILE